MNKKRVLIAFIAWLIASVLMVLTIIGVFVLTKDDRRNEPSTWMKIGLKLLDNLLP